MLRFVFRRSRCRMLSHPIAMSNIVRGATRGGLRSSFSVPGFGREKRRGQLSRRAANQRCSACGLHPAAIQKNLRLLICCQVGQVGRSLAIVDRRISSHQSALIPPRKPIPGSVRLWLILQMCRLLEGLIVIDPEGSRARSSRVVEQNAADLRPEEPRTSMPKHSIGGYAVYLRNRCLHSEAIDLRFRPLNRKRQRRIEQNIEVEITIGVLPEVFAIDDQVFANALLKSGVVLAAACRPQGNGTITRSFQSTDAG